MTAETLGGLRRLVKTGLQLASERRLETIAQIALEAGLELSGAAFGAFFWDGSLALNADRRLPRFSGLAARQLLGPPRARAGEPVSPSPAAGTHLRSDDIQTDPRFDWNLSLAGERPPVRSYLAVPVRGLAGNVWGALVYGDPAPGTVTEPRASRVAILAAQAAAALENARSLEQASEQVKGHVKEHVEEQIKEYVEHREHRHQETAAADIAGAGQRAGQPGTNQRLAHALEAAQMGTWRWAADSGLVDFDERAAELLGVQPHVPLSRNSLRQHLVYREDMAVTAEDLREIAHAGRQYNTEYRIAVPGGGERWVSVRGNATFAAGGEVEGMIGTVQDVTPRKAQEEALRMSEKLAATGRLAATIAHEINNPLEALTNLIYLAKTDPETPVSISRLLEIADNELARVSQIAQHTLGFYRDTTRPATVDLNELLGATVELFGRKLDGKRLRCTLDLEPGLCILGLKGELRQVISNLLVNAIDASPGNGGQIRIRGRHRRRAGSKGVALLICDAGGGIPHGVRRQLFTPFMTTKPSTGTGLGLWVTRGMVEKHGGCIHFRSRTVSPSGTVFRVYLPQSGAPTLFTSPGAAVIQ